jgi:hypothetical protein
MSDVFRTIGAKGGHTRWVERGWGVNSSEVARHCSVLCKYFVLPTLPLVVILASKTYTKTEEKFFGKTGIVTRCMNKEKYRIAPSSLQMIILFLTYVYFKKEFVPFYFQHSVISNSSCKFFGKSPLPMLHIRMLSLSLYCILSVL